MLKYRSTQDGRQRVKFQQDNTSDDSVMYLLQPWSHYKPYTVRANFDLQKPQKPYRVIYQIMSCSQKGRLPRLHGGLLLTLWLSLVFQFSPSEAQCSLLFQNQKKSQALISSNQTIEDLDSHLYVPLLLLQPKYVIQAFTSQHFQGVLSFYHLCMLFFLILKIKIFFQFIT